MKKIIFYTDTPLFGGAENQMLLLARFLDRTKYEIVLVCSGYSALDAWVKCWQEFGFRVLRLNVWHKHDPRHFGYLKKIIQAERPDLFHLHLWNSGACRYAFMAAKKYDLPVVVTEHDPFKLQGMKSFLKRRTLKYTNRVIAISKENKNLLLELYPELKGKVQIVSNGIDLVDFQQKGLAISVAEKVELRKEFYGVDHDWKVVLYVGTLHQRKGLKYLLAAARQFVGQKVRFVLVGDGPQRKELADFVKENHLGEYVKFLGFQKNVIQFFRAADLFVLPTIKEAFGLVILEAMAMKLPVVATNAGGVPDIIEDAKNGLLVPAADVKALGYAIGRLLENKILSEKIVIEASRVLAEKFDAKTMAKNTAKIYEEVFSSEFLQF